MTAQSGSGALPRAQSRGQSELQCLKQVIGHNLGRGIFKPTAIANNHDILACQANVVVPASGVKYFASERFMAGNIARTRLDQLPGGGEQNLALVHILSACDCVVKEQSPQGGLPTPFTTENLG